MKNTQSVIQRPPVIRLVLAQWCLAVVVSLLFLINGVTSAYSAFCGGLIFVIPNAYFAKKAFTYSGARAAREIVKSFYIGEAIKLVLTAVMFTTVFVLVKPLDVLALFTAYFLVLMSNWLVPLVIGRKPQQK